jgi:hypothetical protein
MKKIKIILIFLFIAVGYIFNGELFIRYLDTFQDSYYQSTFSFASRDETLSEADIIRDFLDASQAHQVDFFFLDNAVRSAYTKEITIYGAPNAIKSLQADGIIAGKNGSLFMGDMYVAYHDFSELETIEQFDTCYYIGDQSQLEAMSAFKAALIEQYGGGFPKLLGSDRETWLNLFSVWLIIFVFILLLTAYEIITLKKEVVVRVTLGEDVRTIFAKNALADAAILLCAFIALPIVLLPLAGNPLFKLPALALSFIIVIIANTAINAWILRMSFKKDMVTRRSGGWLLSVNYGLKLLTTILTLIVLSGNFYVLAQGYQLYRQKDFFLEHKDYAYYQLNYKMNNHVGRSAMSDTALMNQDFYRRFQADSLQYADLTANYDSPYPVLLINRNSAKEIAGAYPAMAEAVNNAEEGYYILIPPHISADSVEYSVAEDIFVAFLGSKYRSSIRTKEYADAVSIIGVHNQVLKFRSVPMDSPIILFDNTWQQSDEYQAESDMYYAYDTLYHIPEAEFRAFISEYQLAEQIVAQSNVLDVYQRHWADASRSMKLVVILSLFLLALEIALIGLIIRLEYQFNATEMALKKVLGYSLLARNRRLLSITLAVFLVSLLLAFLLRGLLGLAVGANLLWGGLILVVIELWYISKRAKAMEKANVSSILKGKVL